ADTHTFNWHVVSSNGQMIADGTDPTFSFTPNDNGTYTVTFTVTDSDNGVGSDTVVVTVNNLPPTASFSNTGPVDEGSTVSVRFSNSTDPSSVDAGSLHYFFSTIQAERDSATYESSGASAVTDFTFVDNGTYTVYGRILDKDDGYTDYETAVVINTMAPTA